MRARRTLDCRATIIHRARINPALRTRNIGIARIPARRIFGRLPPLARSLLPPTRLLLYYLLLPTHRLLLARLLLTYHLPLARLLPRRRLASCLLLRTLTRRLLACSALGSLSHLRLLPTLLCLLLLNGHVASGIPSLLLLGALTLLGALALLGTLPLRLALAFP